MSESLERSGDLAEIGGQAYIADLALNTPSAANIRRYAEIVHERALLRRLIAVGTEIQELALENSSRPALDRIDEAISRLTVLADHGTGDEPRPVGEIASAVIDDIDTLAERGGALPGLPTGFADLDAFLCGLKAGDLIIVAGRPSMGKTAFTINIAENVAVSGTPALVFSLEMSQQQLVARLLSSLGGIDGKALASGRLSNGEWERLSAALGKLHALPLFIDDSPSLCVAQMHARARRQERKGGLGLVVIDYLQLMRDPQGGNNRNEELSGITRSLKLMARDLEVPVIVLSQLSRKVEERTDKRPLLADLRDSGAIEQDADVVLMLYLHSYYDNASPWEGIAECLIRKNRMGPTGDVKLVFQPEYSRFCDVDKATVAATAARAREAKTEKRRGFDG